MPQRALPDKAIDLIDMTAAHLAAKHPARDAKAIEKDIEAEEKKQKAAAKKKITRLPKMPRKRLLT